jgi:hypothetical protein
LKVERTRSTADEGAFVQLNDDEDNELMAKKNKGRPDVNKSAKDKLRKQAAAANLNEKIDDLVKSKNKLFNETLEAKRR